MKPTKDFDEHLRTSMAHRAAFTLGKLVKRGEAIKVGWNGLVMTWELQTFAA